MKNLVLHHNDLDGWAAAWVARLRVPDATFIPVQHGEPIPWHEVEAAYDVLIVDFSYPYDDLYGIADACVGDVLVLDHHRTAREALASLPEYGSGALVTAVFDEHRAGCTLTWDTLHANRVRPWWIEYVQDYDLWRHALPNTREINAAIASYPLSFELFDRLDATPLDPWIEAGRHILRYQDALVEDMAKDPPFERVCGTYVPSVPCHSGRLVSALGDVLCDGHPFAAVWREIPGGDRRYSLRSREGGADVQEIAKTFGGGGHVHAAGYTRKGQ